jgi:hypothetical protein
VVAAFDGGAVTSDAGGLLLRHTDRALGLIERVAACFVDHREQDQVEYSVGTLVGQRIVGIALVEPVLGRALPDPGEDVSDHDELLGRRNGVGAPFPNPAAKRPGARAVRRAARGEARGLRAARRQEHAQSAGTRPAAAG